MKLLNHKSSPQLTRCPLTFLNKRYLLQTHWKSLLTIPILQIAQVRYYYPGVLWNCHSWFSGVVSLSLLAQFSMASLYFFVFQLLFVIKIYIQYTIDNIADTNAYQESLMVYFLYSYLLNYFESSVQVLLKKYSNFLTVKVAENAPSPEA